MAPDSSRQTHGQHRARPRLAAARETKQKPSLAPGVQSTTGNTPVPRPYTEGGESNHTSRELPFPIAPRTPSSLSPPPATVTTTRPTDTDFPSHGEGEEVPEEEGFPSARSGCPPHCRASGILAGAAAWHCRTHLPSRLREEGMQRCHSSALQRVSTERSPHCEPRGASGKIKPKVCHQRSPHDLPSPDLPSSRLDNLLPSACSSPRPFRGPC